MVMVMVRREDGNNNNNKNETTGDKNLTFSCDYQISNKGKKGRSDKDKEKSLNRCQQLQEDSIIISWFFCYFVRYSIFTFVPLFRCFCSIIVNKLSRRINCSIAMEGRCLLLSLYLFQYSTFKSKKSFFQ